MDMDMFSRNKRKARKQLDSRLSDKGLKKNLSVPSKGWIRAVREALGMTSAQLGHKLGQKSQSIEDLQKNEVHGNIKLSSLRSVAAAMDCTLVYAFVPNSSFEEQIERRARSLALEELSRIKHYMTLEDQDTDAELEEEIHEYIEEFISERDLWN